MRRAALLFLWLEASAASAAAPVTAGLVQHLERGLPASHPGDWITYRVEGGPSRTAYWRLAVVGEARDRLGREAWWVEMEFGGHPDFAAPLAQLRLLLSKRPGPERLTRAFVAVGAGPVRELDEDQVRQLGQEAPRPTGAPGPLLGGEIFLRGKERRMTSAGAMMASRWDLTSGGTVLQRVWTSPEVPAPGLVRLEVPGSEAFLEIHAWGHDARPRLLLPGPLAPKIRLEGPGSLELLPPILGVSHEEPTSKRSPGTPSRPTRSGHGRVLHPQLAHHRGAGARLHREGHPRPPAAWDRARLPCAPAQRHLDVPRGLPELLQLVLLRAQPSVPLSWICSQPCELFDTLAEPPLASQTLHAATRQHLVAPAGRQEDLEHV